MKLARRMCSLLLGVTIVGLIVSQSAAAEPPVSDDPGSWKLLRSRHFVVSSDASTARATEVIVGLELFRGAFAHLAPGLSLRSPTPTEIVAFRSEESYRDYKTPADARVLGQFLQRIDGNYLTLNAGTQLTDAFAVVFHEYVHYLVQANFPGVPRWFNEGLAEYYSTFVILEDEVVVGRPVERHVQWLIREGERSVRSMTDDFSLDQVLTGEAFEHSERVGGFYAMSWALVHHLLSGDGDRLDRTADFLASVGEGQPASEAFESAFDTRLESLESILLENARARRYPETALEIDALSVGGGVQVASLRRVDVLFRLGDLLLQLNQEDRARSHLHRALDLEGEHPEALAALACLLDRESRFAEAEVLFGEAMQGGSLDPRTYFRYGWHQIQRLRAEGATVQSEVLEVPGGVDLDSGADGSESSERASFAEAARAALRRAIQLDPEFAGAHVLFGMAHLLDDVDPSPGIESLTKAWRWLPGREDVPLWLLQLYLREHRFEEAEEVYRLAFAGRPDSVNAFRAREAIDVSVLLFDSNRALEAGALDEGLRILDEAVSVTSDPLVRERLEQRLLALQQNYGMR